MNTDILQCKFYGKTNKHTRTYNGRKRITYRVIKGDDDDDDDPNRKIVATYTHTHTPPTDNGYMLYGTETDNT